ncbi:MAG: helix-turn-helix domain-containing protein [Ferruginibacter sp.]
MQNKYPTNIITLLARLSSQLRQSYADKNLNISFAAAEKQITLEEPGQMLENGLSKIATSILDLIPPGNCFFIEAKAVENCKECLVTFRNTGINLKIVAGIFRKSPYPIKIYSGSEKETVFEIRFLLATNGKNSEPNGIPIPPESPFNYISVIKGIKTYFSKIKSGADLLNETNPKEGKFLQKINAVVIAKIADEQFDANALSTELSMSRAQLLRRLKKITGLSPAQYIKSVRLQKAKEMLEADFTVSEAAFESGFGTLSNFTKVFREKYGITPSQWRQTRPVQQINKK